jgi:nucleoside 2-deoxyribosyltransferase
MTTHAARVPWFVVLCGLAGVACDDEDVATPAGDVSGADASPEVYYIYLAGPEVFLPDAVAAGQEKKDIIARLSSEMSWPFRLEGLYPLDNAIDNFGPNRETGIRIYHANMGQIVQAHAVLANMVRFRSPSMDVGTAFEMGAARGMNKPVFAYYEAAPFYGMPEEPGLYVERVARFYGLSEVPEQDPDGLSVENFGMSDNLMMMGAIDEAGHGIETDFERAVTNIAEYFLAQR